VTNPAPATNSIWVCSVSVRGAVGVAAHSIAVLHHFEIFAGA
jgi:hypothetical protein